MHAKLVLRKGGRKAPDKDVFNGVISVDLKDKTLIFRGSFTHEDGTRTAKLVYISDLPHQEITTAIDDSCLSISWILEVSSGDEGSEVGHNICLFFTNPGSRFVAGYWNTGSLETLQGMDPKGSTTPRRGGFAELELVNDRRQLA